ncbi:hypothetical protein [Methylovorus glucosotrophus]|uniref:Uncharacterized protein n=1 Tax=Methylovorus glucosotrophus (strain SIP3-4) TaxID=582744 RepID=C6X7T7_METGS|nr:hypothetical protein [Methylovorus glucosotrophus]ACT51264.1 hypothetical protein Msip34_2022 [Methylovorus glucosotrophus SIP3-4]
MVEHYLNKQEKLNEREVGNWLESYGVRNYTINEDLTVDVKGDVYLKNRGITNIPIQFGKVGKNFHCEGNNLTSLKGCPIEVGNYFDCSNNKLETLEFAPLKVGGSFDCSDNKLVDLKFAPKEIGGEFRVLEISNIFDIETRTPNNNFTNNIYNELDPKELLNYVQKEEFANKLRAELPKQDDFRTIIDSKQIQDLHAQILERNKTVEIPDTYITEANKPKEEVKEVKYITKEAKEDPIVNVSMTRTNKIKL